MPLKPMDLSRDPDSPSWHEDVLRERDEQVAAGEAEFIDWEEAKVEILRTCRDAPKGRPSE